MAITITNRNLVWSKKTENWLNVKSEHEKKNFNTTKQKWHIIRHSNRCFYYHRSLSQGKKLSMVYQRSNCHCWSLPSLMRKIHKIKEALVIFLPTFSTFVLVWLTNRGVCFDSRFQQHWKCSAATDRWCPTATAPATTHSPTTSSSACRASGRTRRRARLYLSKPSMRAC